MQQQVIKCSLFMEDTTGTTNNLDEAPSTFEMSP